jgi:serine/threonine-protein kinase
MLRRGPNRIVVRASNLGGVTISRTVRVRYLPGPCVVPTLQGRRLAAARLALLMHGCGVGAIRLRYSRSVARGRVIGSRPAQGTRRRHGARVALLISAGRR